MLFVMLINHPYATLSTACPQTHINPLKEGKLPQILQMLQSQQKHRTSTLLQDRQEVELKMVLSLLLALEETELASSAF